MDVAAKEWRAAEMAAEMAVVRAVGCRTGNGFVVYVIN